MDVKMWDEREREWCEKDERERESGARHCDERDESEVREWCESCKLGERNGRGVEWESKVRDWGTGGQ